MSEQIKSKPQAKPQSGPFIALGKMRPRALLWVRKFATEFHKKKQDLLLWIFRFCGGYHRLEHDRLLHQALCKAEVETAELRLYKVLMDDRFKSLNRMLAQELQKKVT